MKAWRRGLRGDGGGGNSAVVVGTGEVVVVGGTTGTPPLVVAVSPGAVAPVPVVPREVAAVADEGAAPCVPPPCDERTTAVTAPAPATTAIPTASRSFLTWREATLARA
jgi:hypothetical protein